MKKNVISKELILNNIKVDENGCWIWQRPLAGYGYGGIHVNGKHCKPHRISYEVFRGKFDQKMLVCHICDVRSCVNPHHLFIGTEKDNAIDAKNKNRTTRGEKHGCSKLKLKQVLKIINDYSSGVKVKDMAKTYSVAESTIHRILNGKKWNLPEVNQALAELKKWRGENG